ncbi:hypothetical protein, conserved [Plasmodium gonderi]|uniref:Uncharacterized protein n=1 Tax=Plasmodium gonderi TaxID=77519 RepID=A0A1Y1JRI8_PLAGO|nr:hypothetical protein, conserved [Plasmodium gonderi]GAW82624.1 hypothetical protein, conserved [Plasmodium gonderi]
MRFFLIPCYENKHIQVLQNLQYIYEYVNNKNYESPSDLINIQNEGKRKRSMFVRYPSEIVIYNDPIKNKDENYVNGKSKNYIHNDMIEKLTRQLKKNYNTVTLKYFEYMNHMFNFNYESSIYDNVYTIGYDKIWNSSDTSNVNIPDYFFSAKRMVMSKGKSNLVKLNRILNSSNSSSYTWNIKSEEREFSPHIGLMDINSVSIPNNCKNFSCPCQSNRLKLMQETYEYDIYPLLKGILKRNLHRRNINIANKSEMYYTDYEEKITPSNSIEYEYTEQMQLFFHSKNKCKNDMMNHSKNIKRKKKKQRKRGKEKKNIEIIDNYITEKNFYSKEYEGKNDIVFHTKQNYVYCIKKKVLSNNFTFLNVMKKYIQFKMHFNELIPVGGLNEKTYSLCISERSSENSEKKKKKAQFISFLEHYYSNKSIIEKDIYKKIGDKTNKEQLLNKRDMLIFDYLKRETTYLTISYIMDGEKTYIRNMTEYYAPLKVPLYTCSFMHPSEEIESNAKMYEEYDGYISHHLTSLNIKSDMCHYNYGNNCIDYFKNAFLKICKIDMDSSDDTFKGNNLLHKKNKARKKSFIKEHMKECIQEMQDKMLQGKTNYNGKKNRKKGGCYKMPNDHLSAAVHTRIRFIKKYAHLRDLKSFYCFIPHMLIMFRIYRELFSSEKLKHQGNYQDRMSSTVRKSYSVNDDEKDEKMEKLRTNGKSHNKTNGLSRQINGNNSNFIISTYAGSDKRYHYFLIKNYNNKSYIFEVTSDSELYKNLFMNNTNHNLDITETEKILINNMNKEMKGGNNFSVYMEHRTPPEVYNYNCKKFNTIKWALMLFFIPAWLLITIVYILHVQNIWGQMLNPLYRLMLSPSIIRLASYVMLLLFCMLQYPYNNTPYVEYTILGYMALNTMFITIFYGNLILISKGFMITRGQFNKRENLSLTLMISSIYILTSFNQLNIISDTPILIFINMSLLLFLTSNIISILNFLKLKLSFVRSIGIMDTWEESIKIKLNMYKSYLLIIIAFFSFEILLHLLKTVFNFLTGTVTLIEYAFELIVWCCVLYIFRYRGNILYFSLLHDNLSLNITPLYIVKTSDQFLDMLDDKQRPHDSSNFPILILNPTEDTDQNYLSCMAVGCPIISHYGKKYI